MPLIKLEELEAGYVTPKYSTAYGELVLGETIEVGRFNYSPEEGAVEHAHPHEQVMIVISGRLAVEIPDEGIEAEAGPWEGFHVAPNVTHKVTAIEDTIVISCKNTIDGVGHKIAPGEMDRLKDLGKI
jgi:quercetin dioxygenase-like cupin family protein